MRTLAERIKALRMPGETQAQFADRLDTTQASISRYLNGRQPDRETLVKIARQTCVSLDWLLTGAGPGPAEKPKKEPPDTELVQAIVAYLGDLQNLSAKEKAAAQALLRDLCDNKDSRREILAYWEALAKTRK
jgi:transcriptional regulator with XRE-family HTH domain